MPAEQKFPDCELGRNVVTKYCSKEVLDSMLRGELWFGSLLKYRKCETDNGLMSDFYEGLTTRLVDFQHSQQPFTGKVSQLNIIKQMGASIAPGTGAIGFKREIDKFIFCTSWGPYSRSHHQKMMHGSQDFPDYKGEPNNDHFIVIDIPTFENAVLGWCASIYGAAQIRHAPCIYCKDRQCPLDKSEHESGRIDENKTAIIKPDNFRIENEYRFLIQIPNRPPSISDDTLKMKSMNLTTSFLAYGQYN